MKDRPLGTYIVGFTMVIFKLWYDEDEKRYQDVNHLDFELYRWFFDKGFR